MARTSSTGEDTSNFTITAVYSGDSNFVASSQSIAEQVS
jgi:hypothetical protein